MVAAVRVSLFHLQTKTNSADAFPEDELLLEDGLLPEDELGCYVLGFSLPMRTHALDARLHLHLHTSSCVPGSSLAVVHALDATF